MQMKTSRCHPTVHVLLWACLLLLLLIQGCAGMLNQTGDVSFKYEPYAEGITIPEQKEPAAVADRKAEPLAAEGYVVIGRITVYQEQGKSYAMSPTQAARQEAAKKGGTMILLESDNERNILETFRNGVCIRNESRQVCRSIPEYTTETDSYGHVYSRQTGSHQECHTEWVCMEHEQIPVHIPVVQTIAKVLSNDPVFRPRALSMKLLNALHEGNRKEALQCIKDGADPSFKTSTGETVLVAAVKRGYADIVKALIEKGADVNATLGWGSKTALDYAEDPAIVRILRKAGAVKGERSTDPDDTRKKGLLKGLGGQSKSSEELDEKKKKGLLKGLGGQRE